MLNNLNPIKHDIMIRQQINMLDKNRHYLQDLQYGDNVTIYTNGIYDMKYYKCIYDGVEGFINMNDIIIPSYTERPAYDVFEMVTPVELPSLRLTNIFNQSRL